MIWKQDNARPHTSGVPNEKKAKYQLIISSFLVGGQRRKGKIA
jgi:hypothetical protein